ncbi:hypothetical protein HID58_049473 [Brassica napus]|uniref:DUF223 domain-containing protein n=1 Tax=Brassica napus TaxID=3708 RepID=A0ABQ8B6N3_BRANA|nr:hypothetical protein HID58_049473 [Brassica napus]
MPLSLGMNSHTETKSRSWSLFKHFRILSFWEARNVKKYGQLMDVDMLLIDKQDSVKQTTELFRFCNHDQLLSLANTNKQLPGNVSVSPFDDLTFAFHNKLESYGSEPKVVLVTSINPKVVGGRLFVNGTFPKPISTVTLRQLSVKDSMKSKYLLQIQVVWGWFNQPASTSKLVHAQKIEPLTLSELNQYVLTSASQTFTFTEQQRPPLPDFVIHVGRGFDAHQQPNYGRCSIMEGLGSARCSAGDGQEPNDDVPVEKPVASNGSIGADNTLAEVASGVGAEVGETTSANHSHPHLLLQD